MNNVSGQRVCFMSWIASFPLFPILTDWSHMPSAGLGWAGLGWSLMTVTSQQGQTQQREGAFVVCSLLALLLFLFACSLSIHQWLISPAGLDSSFTCSLPHSCSKSLAPGPLGVSGAVWFSESPKPDLSASNVFLSIKCLSPYVCFFCYSEDFAVTRSVQMLVCMRIGAFIQCVPPFIAVPWSTEIKSHFLAAEAVIPCCQGPLYCRSCICLRLPLSIVNVGAASMGTIMHLRKQAKRHFAATSESACSESQRWGKTARICLSSLEADLSAFC